VGGKVWKYLSRGPFLSGWRAETYCSMYFLVAGEKGIFFCFLMLSVNNVATNVELVPNREVEIVPGNTLRLHMLNPSADAVVQTVEYDKVEDSIFPATYMPQKLVALLIRRPISKTVEEVAIAIKEPHPSVLMGCNGSCKYVLPSGTLGGKYGNAPDDYKALPVDEEIVLLGNVQLSGEVHLGNFGDLHFRMTNSGFNVITLPLEVPIPVPVPSGYGKLRIPKLSNIYNKV